MPCSNPGRSLGHPDAQFGTADFLDFLSLCIIIKYFHSHGILIGTVLYIVGTKIEPVETYVS